MRSLEAIILLGKDNGALNSFLIVETFLIDGSLGDVWLDDMKLAQMSSTLAFFADTLGRIMVAEIRFGQLGRSLIEDIIIMHTLGLVVP
jgi:hypothetical protein